MVHICRIALRLLRFELVLLQELLVDGLVYLLGLVLAEEDYGWLATVLLLLDFDADESVLVQECFFSFEE